MRRLRMPASADAAYSVARHRRVLGNLFEQFVDGGFLVDYFAGSPADSHSAERSALRSDRVAAHAVPDDERGPSFAGALSFPALSEAHVPAGHTCSHRQRDTAEHEAIGLAATVGLAQGVDHGPPDGERYQHDRKVDDRCPRSRCPPRLTTRDVLGGERVVGIEARAHRQRGEIRNRRGDRVGRWCRRHCVMTPRCDRWRVLGYGTLVRSVRSGKGRHAV